MMAEITGHDIGQFVLQLAVLAVCWRLAKRHNYGQSRRAWGAVAFIVVFIVAYQGHTLWRAHKAATLHAEPQYPIF